MENNNRNKMLAALSSALPHGEYKRVAERAGVHTQTVCAFLKGKTKNYRVEFAILQIIAEIHQERKRLITEAGF